MDKALNDGMDKDLIDGIYNKILYVKTLNGKTISIEYDPQNTVDSAKEQIERKTRILKEQQHLVRRGKVLDDKLKIEDDNMKEEEEEETIEMIAALLGGTKRDESRPISKNKGREAKRKATKPSLEVGGLKDNKSASKDPYEKMEGMMQKMEETISHFGSIHFGSSHFGSRLKFLVRYFPFAIGDFHVRS